MNIKIGRIIERKQKKCVGKYVINLNWVYDDADSFEDQDLCYDVNCKEDVEAFEKVYKCCKAFTELNHDTQCDVANDYNKFFSKVLNLPEENDVIYDHNAQSQCFLDEFNAWYEDEHENKFELIIKV